MAKVILGARPKSFSKTVEFPMLDGTVGSIKVDYIYRTRTEFGELIDGINGESKAKADLPPTVDQVPVAFSLEKHSAETIAANADYILKIANGWDLDSEFSRASLIQLGDEVPAAHQAIMDTYRLAITEGRLGN